jgi:hypothetical protein
VPFVCRTDAHGVEAPQALPLKVRGVSRTTLGLADHRQKLYLGQAIGEFRLHQVEFSLGERPILAVVKEAKFFASLTPSTLALPPR